MKFSFAQQIALTVAAVLLIALTGGVKSPLFFILYLPVLLTTLSTGSRQGVGLGLALGVIYALDALLLTKKIAFPRPIILSVALSFPAVALFAALLSRRLADRYNALDKKAREMSALLDVSQMIDSAFDLDMTLNLILLNVQTLTECAVCAVYLKEDAETLALRAASGPHNRLPPRSSWAVADVACGDWSLTAALDTPRHPIFFLPETAGAPCSPLEMLDPAARSFACLPLVSVEGLLGMLYVGYDQPHGLDAEGVARLAHLATRVGASLQRVLVQEEFQEMAFRDAMTGLDNFRQFERSLNDEIRRAERYNRPVSVILLDIDHFKNFNDTLGHPAGDALLSQLAVVLQNSLRDVDKPARYGGEEFAILCPETGKDEARVIAERIRQSVEETAFALLDPAPGSDAPPTCHVTVSVGYATCPADAHVARDLVKRADEALYAAKTAGRNAVRAYAPHAAHILAA